MARASCAAKVSTMTEKSLRAPLYVNRQPIALRHSGTSIVVNPGKLSISCGTHTDIPEEVEWVSLEGCEGFTVRFDKPEGSPFVENTFEVPAGGTVSSGQITGELGEYRYTVFDRHDHKKDPVIIVTP